MNSFFTWVGGGRALSAPPVPKKEKSLIFLFLGRGARAGPRIGKKGEGAAQPP